MTSTNFNIGMFENRNSSRILKPPGGGHSQIFGFTEESAPKKVAQRSEITACFKHDEYAKVQTQSSIEVTTESTTENCNKTDTTEVHSTTDDNIDNGNGMEEKDTGEKIGTPSRKRVPPGGFSSGGFW